MFLNALHNSFAPKINLHNNNLRVISTQPISFTSKPDSFDSLSVVEQDFSDDVPSAARKKIIDDVKYFADKSNYVKPIGIGANGKVYKLSYVRGYENGLAIKISHNEDKNSLSGEMQRVNCDFSDEADILKAAQMPGSKSQQYVGALKFKDGRSVLITTFVKGSNPDIDKKPLNRDNLASLLETLEQLDEKGILHRDLKQENIVIDDNDNAGLIDFGESITFDILDFDKNTQDNNFPPFEPPSNIRSFEDTLLSPYINELMKRDPKAARELFSDYLSLKSELVYSKRADRLEEYALNNSCSLDEKQKAKLEDMIKYLSLQAKMTENPFSGVVDIELLKNQITYSAELAYKNEVLLLNPLANVTLKVNSLIAAKKLEALTLKKLERPNSLDIREYLRYQNEYAKFRQQKLAGWTMGLVGWLTDCLSSDIKTAPDYKQGIIDQCVNGDNLEDFEIPDIAKGVK